MSSNGSDPHAETAEQWWDHHAPTWKENSAYYDNLTSKAERFGKEWVRQHKSSIDAYWRNAGDYLRAKAFVEEHGSLDDW